MVDDGETQTLTMRIVLRDLGRQGDGDDRGCHNGWISMRELWGSGDGETCKDSWWKLWMWICLQLFRRRFKDGGGGGKLVKKENVH